MISCKKVATSNNVTSIIRSSKRHFQQQSWNWSGYLKKFEIVLEKRPILVNTFIGGFFMFAGDLTQQLLYNDKIKQKEVHFGFNNLYISMNFRLLVRTCKLSKFVSYYFSIMVLPVQSFPISKDLTSGVNISL